MAERGEVGFPLTSASVVILGLCHQVHIGCPVAILLTQSIYHRLKPTGKTRNEFQYLLAIRLQVIRWTI